MRTRMFGDSPEKLLEDIKVCKTQDAAWRKDHSSIVAKRNRSNYLLICARDRAVLKKAMLPIQIDCCAKPKKSRSRAASPI